MFCFFLLLSTLAFSQKDIDVDKAAGVPQNSFYTVNGTPFVNSRFVHLVDGTPYFKDAWMKALAVDANGRRYQNSMVKLDLFSNEVHFLVSGGNTELICTLPLKELSLTDTVSGASYHFVQAAVAPLLASLKSKWYLQLASGKASLFQEIRKVLQEDKPYNASTVVQNIVTSNNLYLAYNGTLVKVKKPQDAVAVLADKKSELEAFLKAGQQTGDTPAERLAALVAYYNSLQ